MFIGLGLVPRTCKLVPIFSLDMQWRTFMSCFSLSSVKLWPRRVVAVFRLEGSDKLWMRFANFERRRKAVLDWLVPTVLSCL